MSKVLLHLLLLTLIIVCVYCRNGCVYVYVCSFVCLFVCVVYGEKAVQSPYSTSFEHFLRGLCAHDVVVFFFYLRHIQMHIHSSGSRICKLLHLFLHSNVKRRNYTERIVRMNE